MALATSADAEAFAGENARVIGWGTREYGGTSLQWQHYVDVPVLSDDGELFLFMVKPKHLKKLLFSFKNAVPPATPTPRSLRT